MYSEKFLENSIKLLRNPRPVILQTFFPQSQKTLKNTWKLKGHSSETQRSLEHSKGTRETLFSRLLRKDITFPCYVLNLISQKPRNFLHVSVKFTLSLY